MPRERPLIKFPYKAPRGIDASKRVSFSPVQQPLHSPLYTLCF